MCAGFPAGTGNAHRFVNRSARDVLLLVIGDRTAGDEASYPDIDMHVRMGPDQNIFTRKDGAPFRDRNLLLARGNRHCERSEAIRARAAGLLRSARNDDFGGFATWSIRFTNTIPVNPDFVRTTSQSRALPPGPAAPNPRQEPPA